MSVLEAFTTYTGMSAVELLGVLTGLAGVGLTVRQSVWNWPIGIVSSLAFFEVFREARLYADMLLQLVYVGMSLYGWYHWLHPDDRAVALPVTRARPRELAVLALLAVAATAVWGGFLAGYTDASLPFWDAGTVATSLAAQWLLTQKRVENWMVWIATDIVLIGVYEAKDLHLTAALYAVFTVLAALGLRTWWRDLPVGSLAPATADAR